MTKAEQSCQESLARARNGKFGANDALVILEFSERGIPASEIAPRENVLTFNAWRALGRSVKKGEKGVKITTFVERSDKDSGEPHRYPRGVTVFHISQTEEMSAKA